MKKLTIFQQVMILIVVSLLLFSSLIFGFFSYATKLQLQKNQVTAMFATTNSIVKTVKSIFSLNNEAARSQENYLRSLPDVIASDIFIVYFDPQRAANSSSGKTGKIHPEINYNDTINYCLRENHGYSESEISEIIWKIKTTVNNLLVNGSNYSFDINLNSHNKSGNEYVCTASSFNVNRRSDKTHLRGAVFLVKSKTLIRSNLLVLNLSLLIGVSLTLLLMIIPILLLVTRLIKPLVKTRDVALAMQKGDFTQRADENAPAEIGDLAKSVNKLSYNLNLTLSSLHFEKNRLQQLLNNLAEGVLAYDASLLLTHQNQAMLTLFKPYLLEEHKWPDKGRAVNWLQILALEKEFKQALLTGEAASYKRNYGKMIVAVDIYALSNELNNIVGVLASFRDITEQEEREQTQKDYVANVSHELRTPLTAIRALIEPLCDGIVDNDEDKLRYYHIILDETMRLSRLINQILTLSRLQAKKEKIALEDFSAAELLLTVKSKMLQLAKEKDIELQIPELPDYQPEAADKERELYNPAELKDFDLHNYLNHDVLIRANFDYLEQLLIILLDNAMKHTPAGGKVQIVVSRGTGCIVISVVDNGEGIAADQQKYVFERFYKIDSSREQTRGNGLGLSIAKQIVESLGGKIWLTSRLHRGSCFSFSVKEGAEESAE